MKLLDVETGAEIRSFVLDRSMNAAAFSPDGHHVLSVASSSSYAILWNVDSGDRLQTFTIKFGYDLVDKTVAFLPDGSRILTIGFDGITMWNVELGERMLSLGDAAQQTSGIKAASLSPDGRYIISAIKHPEVTTRSPDGESIISVIDHPEIALKLWDAATGAEVRVFTYASPFFANEEVYGHIDAVAFSPDGRYVLSGDSRNCRLTLWDVNSGAEIYSAGESSCPFSVAFSPDGRHILGGGKNGLELRETQNGIKLPGFQSNSNYINLAVFSPDGRYVLSGEGKVELVTTGEIRGHAYAVKPVCKNCTVRLRDVKTGTDLGTFPKTKTEKMAFTAAFSPNGRHALVGYQCVGETSCDGSNSMMMLWDVETREEIRSFSGNARAVYTVAFSPDGRYILSSGGIDTSPLLYGSVLRLWDTETGAELRRFWAHTGMITSVAFSHDGRYAYSGSMDGTIKVWETGIALAS
ncbi:MAG: WD40 repeat domain-containing protein, partial [Gammaproteobacteria bacterium]|nr:WD40 repeat domain-containing protein [Gammaproteobacteria bacterium]